MVSHVALQCKRAFFAHGQFLNRPQEPVDRLSWLLPAPRYVTEAVAVMTETSAGSYANERRYRV